MAFRRQILAATAAIALAGASASAQQGGPEPPATPGVRALTPMVAAALTAGLQRSATLREIVRDIAAQGGVVVVEDVSTPLLRRKGLNGATSHDIVCAGRYRFIHVAVQTGRGDATIETLGHELQHVREMLGSDATTAAGVEALYYRIGLRTTRGVFETDMAREAGAQVLREIRRSHE